MRKHEIYSVLIKKFTAPQRIPFAAIKVISRIKTTTFRSWIKVLQTLHVLSTMDGKFIAELFSRVFFD